MLCHLDTMFNHWQTSHFLYITTSSRKLYILCCKNIFQLLMGLVLRYFDHFRLPLYGSALFWLEANLDDQICICVFNDNLDSYF